MQKNKLKMPPVKVKGSCCVPHCPNIRGVSKKQFFKVGANLENRQKWMIGKTVIPKSQIVHCCEDHFDVIMRFYTPQVTNNACYL